MNALITLLGLFVCLGLQAQVSNEMHDPVESGATPSPEQGLFAFIDSRSPVITPIPTAGSSEFARYRNNYRPYLLGAPKDAFGAFLQTGVFATTDGVVPFWMRSRRFGSIPADGISGSFVAGASKDYLNRRRNQVIDWGAGVEIRFNAASKSEATLIQAYAKARAGIFQLKIGRSREITGLVDSTLSSGAFAVSGNALGIPKVEIGLLDYWEIPLTNHILAIKWTLSHGWVGSYDLNKNERNDILSDEVDSYFHQKTLYGRLGKPNWKVKLYGGLNHQVIWGNEDKIFSGWGLSKIESFKYVFIGKKYGNESIPTSKVGNNIGSIDQALEWNMRSVRLTCYHQFFYEVGALVKLANVKDGLWGISLQNTYNSRAGVQWKKFLFEFLYTKSQGGEVDSKPRSSGAEDYYNNFLYSHGWSYQGENLGNPFLTSQKYIREGYPERETQYFPNNRLMALHGGADFTVDDWKCRALLSYSINYGTYTTSPAERLGPNIVYHDPPYFPQVNQFSAMFETRRELRYDFELGIQLAIDQGDLLPNSVGAGLTLTKRW